MRMISKLCWFGIGFATCFALFMVYEPKAAKNVGNQLSEKVTDGAKLAGKGIEATKVVIAKIQK